MSDAQPHGQAEISGSSAAGESSFLPRLEPSFPYTRELFQRDPPHSAAFAPNAQGPVQLRNEGEGIQRIISPEIIDSESDEDDMEESEEQRRLKRKDPIEYFSRHLVAVLVPVSITMILVIFYVRSLNVSTGSTSSSATLVYEDSEGSDSERLGGAILNALIFVGMIIGVTVVLVILYVYRCTSLIYGWLILSTLSLLGFFGSYLFIEMLDAYNRTIDYYSMAFVAWNFATVGALSIFWKAPMRLNQAYLIMISSLMAWSFTKLPEWTTWAILAAVAIYDLFAVLAPKGPLKVLIETSQQRQEPIPGLLYNTYMVWIPVVGGPLIHMDTPVKGCQFSPFHQWPASTYCSLSL
eukprot:TRINITY_DN6083_c0_g1_i3.p1 TRINITY_DN6083_c0_g1~~TRINITY_DN6083_c0_g1_i3.p1  ORF type:complete len:352 (-),score=63.15 TRINITY_DN6083_c0_g1_i3:134-1189(-)